MAFSKKRIEDRKGWLSSYVPGTYLDNSGDAIGYSDFINKVCGVQI
jgi:DNA topoisomerase-2